MKNITVVVSESGKFHDIQLPPGSTCSDILKTIGLPKSYLLSAGKSSDPWGADEVIYSLVEEGAKIYASQPVDVGVGRTRFHQLAVKMAVCLWCVLKTILRGVVIVFDVIVSLIRHFNQRGSASSRVPKPIQTMGPSTSNGRQVVSRDERPYWEQAGWKRHGSMFTGWFRTKWGSFEGKARRCIGGVYKLYIKKPPDVLQKHQNWQCFFQRPGHWFFIHTHGPTVRDLNSAIMKVERILTEAYSL